MSYTVTAIYSGYNSEVDAKLYKAAGRSSDGSGCGMGERDHDWEFTNKSAADKCVKNLKKLKLEGLRVSVREDSYDD